MKRLTSQYQLMCSFQATVTVDQTNMLLEIVVPGLAEKRPSLRKTDRVHVKLRVYGFSNNSDDVAYEGIIIGIEHNKIKVNSFNTE